MTDRVGDLRAQITANDGRIVDLVNERLRLVDELWHLKRELGADLRDLDRERALGAELSEANAGPLSDAGLERLVVALLELTRLELD